jgi:hypothetical protein
MTGSRESNQLKSADAANLHEQDCKNPGGRAGSCECPVSYPRFDSKRNKCIRDVICGPDAEAGFGEAMNLAVITDKSGKVISISGLGMYDGEDYSIIMSSITKANWQPLGPATSKTGTWYFDGTANVNGNSERTDIGLSSQGVVTIGTSGTQWMGCSYSKSLRTLLLRISDQAGQ